MKPRRGEATIEIEAPPDRVFAALAAGADWPKGGHERAHVIELDRAERRLAYRSKRDEDNPSFAVWTWQVDPAPGGDRSTVTLAWELRPVTFVRKRLAPVRNRRIARTEAPTALDALRRRVASPSASSAAEAGST